MKAHWLGENILSTTNENFEARTFAKSLYKQTLQETSLKSLKRAEESSFEIKVTK